MPTWELIKRKSARKIYFNGDAMRKILLHICCGPCSIYPVKKLRDEGYEVYGYFYNPNIHPYTEFARRLETLEQYAAEIDLPLIADRDYNLEDYLQRVVFREGNRCRICYHMRLKQAASVARKGKFDSFTTTLLVSPYQKHQVIAETGAALGRENDIPFTYFDFREGYKEATAISKERGMYRQQYCGCIFSEKDRYYRKKEGHKR